MLSVNIGPLALPANVLLLAGAALVALVVGHLVGRRRRVGIGNVLGDMLLAGIIMARIGFVTQWFDLYRNMPWTIIDIRDGGFMLPAGIAGALLVALWQSWRRPLLRQPLIAGVVAGSLAWGTSFALLQEPERAPMPAVALTTLSGTPVQLADIAHGKPLVVNLWATWCPPCRREMPVLAAAQQQERDVLFAFANQGENTAAVERYLSDSRLTLANVLLDPSRQLAHAVGSRGLPTTLFYDGAGHLVASHVGELSQASLEAKLSRLRAPGIAPQASAQ